MKPVRSTHATWVGSRWQIQNLNFKSSVLAGQWLKNTELPWDEIYISRNNFIDYRILVVYVGFAKLSIESSHPASG